MRRLAQVVSYPPCLAVGDIFCANLGFGLAFLLRFGSELVHKQANVDAYVASAPLLTIAICAVMYINDLYVSWLHRSLGHLTVSIVLSMSMLAVATMALSFWARDFAFPRSVILISILVQSALLIGFRAFVQYLQKRYIGPERVLIIANDGQSVSALAMKFRQHGASWYEVKEFLPADSISELSSRLDDIDVVVVAANVQQKGEALEICSRYDKEVLIVPNMLDLMLHTARAETIDDVLTFSIRPSSLSPMQLLLKRTVDLVGSIVMLAIAGPVMLLLAIAIWISSPGSAFFKQERAGRHGRRYLVYKFRTMISDAERHTGPTLAGKDDPRITKIGRLLRATRLDELPQLFNVLKGDMSLVGPRPERPFFVEQFEALIPSYGLRMMVKPGITGLAQIKGRYDTTPERKLRFDLLYIWNYSLLLDLKILFRTLRVLFEPEQASGVAESGTEPLRHVMAEARFDAARAKKTEELDAEVAANAYD